MVRKLPNLYIQQYKSFVAGQVLEMLHVIQQQQHMEMCATV